MTNEQVFTAFTEGREAKGGSVRSEKSGDVLVLFSYATPIAYRVIEDETLIFFDDRKYSVTTSKQQSQAQRIASQSGVSATVVEHKNFRNRLQAHGVYLGGAR